MTFPSICGSARGMIRYASASTRPAAASSPINWCGTRFGSRGGMRRAARVTLRQLDVRFSQMCSKLASSSAGSAAMAVPAGLGAPHPPSHTAALNRSISACELRTYCDMHTNFPCKHKLVAFASRNNRRGYSSSIEPSQLQADSAAAPQEPKAPQASQERVVIGGDDHRQRNQQAANYGAAATQRLTPTGGEAPVIDGAAGGAGPSSPAQQPQWGQPAHGIDAATSPAPDSSLLDYGDPQQPVEQPPAVANHGQATADANQPLDSFPAGQMQQQSQVGGAGMPAVAAPAAPAGSSQGMPSWMVERGRAGPPQNARRPSFGHSNQAAPSHHVPSPASRQGTARAQVAQSASTSAGQRIAPAPDGPMPPDGQQLAGNPTSSYTTQNAGGGETAASSSPLPAPSGVAAARPFVPPWKPHHVITGILTKINYEGQGGFRIAQIKVKRCLPKTATVPAEAAAADVAVDARQVRFAYWMGFMLLFCSK